MQNEKYMNEYDDEIDLRELFLVLWRAKKIIVKITAIFAVISVIYSLLVPNQYVASTVLSPAQQDTGGFAGALGQLGGLASLAGASCAGGSPQWRCPPQHQRALKKLLKLLKKLLSQKGTLSHRWDDRVDRRAPKRRGDADRSTVSLRCSRAR